MLKRSEGIHLTYLAHLKNRALKYLKNNLFSVLITHLFLLIRYTFLVTVYRKVAAIIGIAPGVAQSEQKKNMDE